MTEIKLRSSDLITLVDDEDYTMLLDYFWYKKVEKHTTYVYGNHKKDMKTSVKMHRIIMKIVDPNIWIDHIDGNGLNNQKSNLRICTPRQNHHNQRKTKKVVTSKYKGVSWVKNRNKWLAQSKTLDGKTINLGRYTNEIDAAIAYNDYALKTFGKFANINIFEEKK